MQIQRRSTFWIGEWALTWDNADGTKGRGTNRIEKILDGKVIQENFQIQMDLREPVFQFTAHRTNHGIRHGPIIRADTLICWVRQMEISECSKQK